MTESDKGFLWRKVSEKEMDSIRREAKAVIDNFSKSLERVSKEKLSDSGVERENFERVEKEGKVCDESFRDLMFKNFRIKDSESDRESEKILQDSRHAPEKSKDFIIAEKKVWS